MVCIDIGIGYFIGGLVLVAYGNFCFYVAVRKPEALFRLTKAKLGARKKSDESVQKFLYVWASIVLLAGIVVFVLGYVNA